MASIFSVLVIAWVVSVQGTLAHSSPPDFLKNLNGTQNGEKVKGIGQLKKYLARLGYIDPTMNSPHDDDHIFDDTLHEALKEYQRFHKINVTGNLDTETVDSMLQPRCGLPDIHNSSFGDMKYDFEGSKWAPNKRNLTVAFPKIITRSNVYYPVNQALHKWADVSDFIFTWVDDVETSDVKMSFQSMDHGDGGPFDGPGGVAAHASPGPNDLTNVFIHFDADENWGTNEYTEKEKLDLQSFALHELGHILGLFHSDDPGAIMYPSVARGVRKDLNSDDKNGIQDLYRN